MKNVVNASCVSLAAILLFASILLVSCGKKEEPKPEKAPGAASQGKTLDNLQTAFDGESNAQAKYEAFAKKADEEGYTKVASLFRAAASAEKIHAGNHADVITKMGGTPKADVKTPEIKSTKENLEAAIKGETDESVTMYPGFIDAAKAEQNVAAIRTFTQAKIVEAAHAKLYQEALDGLAKMKGGKMDFYVCKVCGNTVKVIDFAKCPVCFVPKSEYSKIN